MKPMIIKHADCRINLTQEHAQHLRSEFVRTGLSIKALVDSLKEPPAGLNHRMVSRWLNSTTSAQLDHWMLVLEALENTPDADKHASGKVAPVTPMPRIKLTADKIEKLKALIDQTGMPLKTLFKQHEDSLPKGLTYPTALNWLNETVRTARKDCLDFVVDHYQQLPVVAPTPAPERQYRIKNCVQELELTHDMIRELKALQSSSGLRPRQLLEKQTNVPNGLDHLQVNQWMARKLTWAKEDHFDYIHRIWKAVTDQPTTDDRYNFN